MTNYWLVGAMWSGSVNEDKYDRFIKNGIWEIGWSERDQPKQIEKCKKMKPGDYIAIKKKSGKGDISIRAVGKVVGKMKVVKPHGYGQIKVKWLLLDTAVVVGGRGCFATIHGPYPRTNDSEEREWMDQIFFVSKKRDILPRALFSVGDEEDGRTVTVKSRKWQPRWRNEILRRYSHACCFSGIENSSLLESSHIKPYSKCKGNEEKYDPENGILMNALIHIAYDKHLFSIRPDGSLEFSPQLKDKEIQALGIKKGRKLKVLSNKMRGFLKYRHRIFKRKHSESTQ